MSDTEFLAFLLFTLLVFFLFFIIITKSNKREISEDDIDKEGRIKDDFVNIENVINNLKEFKVQTNPKLKNGYTEKSIQNQLKKYLSQKYVHIIPEYGLEGINATKIDFDIGNGKVGLELKIAKSVFSTSGLHRLVGQIEDYASSKYNSDNLIVAVFGEKNHTEDRAMLKRIREKVQAKGVEFLYIEIPTKNPKKIKA